MTKSIENFQYFFNTGQVKTEELSRAAMEFALHHIGLGADNGNQSRKDPKIASFAPYQYRARDAFIAKRYNEKVLIALFYANGQAKRNLYEAYERAGLSSLDGALVLETAVKRTTSKHVLRHTLAELAKGYTFEREYDLSHQQCLCIKFDNARRPPPKKKKRRAVQKNSKSHGLRCKLRRLFCCMS